MAGVVLIKVFERRDRVAAHDRRTHGAPSVNRAGAQSRSSLRAAAVRDLGIDLAGHQGRLRRPRPVQRRSAALLYRRRACSSPLCRCSAHDGRAARDEWMLVTLVGLVLFGGRLRADLLGRAVPRQRADRDSVRDAAAHHDRRSPTPTCPGDRITPRKLAARSSRSSASSRLFGENVRIDPLEGLARWLAIVASAACAAAAGVATKRHGAALHPTTLNAPAMLVGAATLLAASLVAGDEIHDCRATPATWGAVAYLALAGSVVTFLVYFTLLKTWSVTSLSFISVFTPAIALLLGIRVPRRAADAADRRRRGADSGRRDAGGDARGGRDETATA